MVGNNESKTDKILASLDKPLLKEAVKIIKGGSPTDAIIKKFVDLFGGDKAEKIYEALKAELDEDEDGKIEFKEVVSYGLEQFNNYGIYLFFSLVGGTLITILFMLWRGIIEFDTFLLVCQILSPSSLIGWIIKIILEKIGTKTSKLVEDNKKLNIANNQLKIAMQLKKQYSGI